MRVERQRATRELARTVVIALRQPLRSTVHEQSYRQLAEAAALGSRPVLKGRGVVDMKALEKLTSDQIENVRRCLPVDVLELPYIDHQPGGVEREATRLGDDATRPKCRPTSPERLIQ